MVSSTSTRMVLALMMGGLPGLTVAKTGPSTNAVNVFDAVVYDATSGGVTAATSAARNGLKTALLCASWPACFPEGGMRVGGMSSGGLGQTDIGPTASHIGGIALEFYTKNRQHYGPVESLDAGGDCRLPAANCNATFNLEPHVAEAIYKDLLNDAGVHVYYSAQVQSVNLASEKEINSAASIDTISTVGGETFSAKVWIDASYEGDLFARANVSYRVGREGRDEYNETLAGMSAGSASNQFSVAVNPFDENGSPLPFTSLPPAGRTIGSGDKYVQSYNFRLCLTENKSNLVEWPKPENYSSSDWELLRRYVSACTTTAGTLTSESTAGCQFGLPSCNNAPVPGGKTDMNNCGGIASDYIEGSWDYPEADYDERKTIWKKHLYYQQGLLWTLANDPSIPADVRTKMQSWGLCADEFGNTTISPHWPPALYVRAARRLQGDKIFNQNTPKEGAIGNLSIAIGGYNFDSHNAQRWACKNISACYGKAPRGTSASQSFAFDEGDVQISPGLYQIPFWVMLPKVSEVSNLLVVAAPSASHIGMSTLRMEPQFMMVGHAAGSAASIAFKDSIAIQNLDTAKLHALLLSENMILDV